MQKAVYAVEKFYFIILVKIGILPVVQATGGCDNCNPKEKIEAKDNVVKVLKMVKALDETFYN